MQLQPEQGMSGQAYLRQPQQGMGPQGYFLAQPGLGQAGYAQQLQQGIGQPAYFQSQPQQGNPWAYAQPQQQGFDPRAYFQQQAQQGMGRQGFMPQQAQPGLPGQWGYVQPPPQQGFGPRGAAQQQLQQGFAPVDYGNQGLQGLGSQGSAFAAYGHLNQLPAAWSPPGVARSRRGPKNYARSDERIREVVCECLTLEPMVDVGEVSVEVRNGQVTLEGMVPERQMKHFIEEIVARCWGVQDVENFIRVQHPQEMMAIPERDFPRSERSGVEAGSFASPQTVASGVKSPGGDLKSSRNKEEQNR